MKFRLPILIVLFFASLSLFATEKPAEKPSIDNQLSAFSAKVKKGDVTLSWKISNPKNLYKFKLESRKSSETSFTKIDDVLFTDYVKKDTKQIDTKQIDTKQIDTKQNDTKQTEAVYSFTYKDSKTENGVYFYRLTLADASEGFLSSEELKLGVMDIPDFKLHQNTPNPFNPSTLISYELKSASNVRLSVFTMTGQLVAKLIDEQQTAGNYTVDFNAMNYPELSTGIYFYKLETQYSSDIKKMILAK